MYRRVFVYIFHDNDHICTELLVSMFFAVFFWICYTKFSIKLQFLHLPMTDSINSSVRWWNNRCTIMWINHWVGPVKKPSKNFSSDNKTEFMTRLVINFFCYANTKILFDKFWWMLNFTGFRKKCYKLAGKQCKSICFGRLLTINWKSSVFRA